MLFAAAFCRRIIRHRKTALACSLLHTLVLLLANLLAFLIRFSRPHPGLVFRVLLLCHQLPSGYHLLLRLICCLAQSGSENQRCSQCAR
jgi:hypothetical protein